MKDRLFFFGKAAVVGAILGVTGIAIVAAFKGGRAGVRKVRERLVKMGQTESERLAVLEHIHYEGEIR